MAAERHDNDSTREVRLEGVGLLLGGGVLLALIAGAFLLGRWVERRDPAAELQAGGSGGPLAQVAPLQPAADAARGQDYFDRLAGDEERLERAREAETPSTEEGGARAPVPPPAAPRAAPDTARPAGAGQGGAFYVQVLAVRDREAVADLIHGLERQGYGVRLFTEREGEGLLYKVRVGGYATREQAGVAREALRGAGHPGAFIWPSG